MIRDLDDPVREYVDDGGFDPPHNSKITWRHLLQQTSEWTGTLWDKPDQVDHNRGVGRGDELVRGRRAPAASSRSPARYWEYNDVRVNRLSLALLRVWGRPLPEVFKADVMDPIGASDTWELAWLRNSYVTIDGGTSVRERWRALGRRGLGQHVRPRPVWPPPPAARALEGPHLLSEVLSERWIDLATTPCAVNHGYGCLWWLNRAPELYPSAPASSFFAIGAGQRALGGHPTTIWSPWCAGLTRRRLIGFLGAVLAALD